MPMPTPNSGRDVLNHTLSILLGFDDGVADVVDHLLAIETSEELLGYLSQLLGSDGPAIRNLVDQVSRFKCGEPLSHDEPSPEPESPRTAAAPSPSQSTVKAPEATRPSSANSSLNRLSKLTVPNSSKSVSASGPVAAAAASEKQRQKPSSDGGSKPPALPPRASGPRGSSQVPPPAAATASSAPEPSGAATVQASKAPRPQSHPRRPFPPARGTNPVKCGCYGRFHPSLTNCLYCGRVACEKEGYGPCPHCGYAIDPPPQPPEDVAEDTDKSAADALSAWRHKERLLLYDREFASRTKVFDDQADYYRKESAWLTEDERLEAEKRERQHQEEEAMRRRMKLNLRL